MFLVFLTIAIPVAIACLQLILGRAHDEAFYRRLAQTAAEQGNWQELQSVALEWQRAYSRSPMAYAALGDSFYRQQQLPDAIRAYDMALKLDSSMAEVWARFGASLFNSGKYAEAIDACGNGLKLNPSYSEAMLCQGLAYAFSGDATNTADIYKRLSAMAPAMAANMKDVVKTHACPLQGAKLGKTWCER